MLSRRFPVRALVRQTSADVQGMSVTRLEGAGLNPQEWLNAVQGCETVVHLAARAHVLNESSDDPLTEFRRVNVDMTRACAEAAAQAGVKRFVYVSTIGVHGNATTSKPFRATDELAPHSPYAVSKQEGESAVFSIGRATGMEVTVIRPPLVYGPHVPGNFNSMMRWIQRGVPLPLGSVTGNRRSLVALDNLVDLLITCTNHPAAANEIFLVSDGEDLSTTSLLRRLGLAMGKPARLVSVPPSLLHLAATLLGKARTAQQLLGSLMVDIAYTQTTLGWTPPIGVDEGLRRTCAKLNRVPR
jgi:nucleoside-diphosphate-sugar epimerase